MSRNHPEQRSEVPAVSDFKEFSVSARAGGALSCDPGGCGGGPGGSCQGACRGCREYISFQPKEVVGPAK